MSAGDRRAAPQRHKLDHWPNANYGDPPIFGSRVCEIAAHGVLATDTRLPEHSSCEQHRQRRYGAACCARGVNYLPGVSSIESANSSASYTPSDPSFVTSLRGNDLTREAMDRWQQRGLALHVCTAPQTDGKIGVRVGSQMNIDASPTAIARISGKRPVHIGVHNNV